MTLATRHISDCLSACRRRLTAMLCVLTVVVAAFAQESPDKRHITPVKPETNTTLMPEKGTDEEVVQRYLTGDTASAKAQERKDSLRKIYTRYPKLTDVAIGVNIFDPILAIGGQKYGGIDVNATLNMWNRVQPVVELGVGLAHDTPDDMNFTYKGKLSPYVKVGANYNFTFKNEPKYQAIVGLRVGYSNFGYDITDVHYDNGYWDEHTTFDITGLRSHALWGEMLAGIKVQLWKQISMGWQIRYHTLFNYGKNENGKPWYIPGYGPRNGSVAASLSVYYTIPLGIKKTTNAEAHKTNERITNANEDNP